MYYLSFVFTFTKVQPFVNGGSASAKTHSTRTTATLSSNLEYIKNSLINGRSKLALEKAKEIGICNCEFMNVWCQDLNHRVLVDEVISKLENSYIYDHMSHMAGSAKK